MNTFLAILTIFAAPTDVAANAPLTLQPTHVIEFSNTTEKNTMADCQRVARALIAADKTAYCTVGDATAPVAAE